MRGLKDLSFGVTVTHFDNRIPQGMRGLKDDSFICDVTRVHRIPHGVRGLKAQNFASLGMTASSHSARSVWIEEWCTLTLESTRLVALRDGCVN